MSTQQDSKRTAHENLRRRMRQPLAFTGDLMFILCALFVAEFTFTKLYHLLHIGGLYGIAGCIFHLWEMSRKYAKVALPKLRIAVFGTFYILFACCTLYAHIEHLKKHPNTAAWFLPALVFPTILFAFILKRPWLWRAEEHSEQTNKDATQR